MEPILWMLVALLFFMAAIRTVRLITEYRTMMKRADLSTQCGLRNGSNWHSARMISAMKPPRLFVFGLLVVAPIVILVVWWLG